MELNWDLDMEQELIHFYKKYEGSLLSAESDLTPNGRVELWGKFVKAFQRFYGAGYTDVILRAKWRNVRNATGLLKRKLKRNEKLTPKEKWLQTHCSFLIPYIGMKSNALCYRTTSSSSVIQLPDTDGESENAEHNSRQGDSNDRECIRGMSKKQVEEIPEYPEHQENDVSAEITSEFVFPEQLVEEIITEDHTYSNNDNFESQDWEETPTSRNEDKSSMLDDDVSCKPPDVNYLNCTEKAKTDEHSRMTSSDIDLLPGIKTQLEELESERRALDLSRFIWECYEQVEEGKKILALQKIFQVLDDLSGN